MPSSLLEQLQRDAKKTGAYQAKVAYAQHLIQDAAHQAQSQSAKEIENLLREVHDSASASNLYRAQAWFWRGEFLQRENAEPQRIIDAYENAVDLYGKKHQGLPEFYQACDALEKLLAKDSVKHEFYKSKKSKSNPPEAHLQSTEQETPERRYKHLRLQFEKKEVDFDEYDDELNQLLHHPETTDTLIAKIKFQLVRVALIRVSQMQLTAGNGLDTLIKVKTLCEQLTENAALRDTKKGQSAQAIIDKISKNVAAIRRDADEHEKRPEYKISKSSNWFMQLLYRLGNALYLFTHQEERAEQKKEFIHFKAIKAAESILKLPQFIRKQNVSYGAIQDKLSSESALIEVAQSDLIEVAHDSNLSPCSRERQKPTFKPRSQPYSRVTHTPTSNLHRQHMTLFVKTLTGVTVKVTPHNDSSVEDVKKLIAHQEGIPPDQQRLIFQGRQLDESRLLREYNIPDQSDEMRLCLRLSGD